MAAFDHRRGEHDAQPRGESRVWLGLCALAVALVAWLGPESRVPLQRAYLDPGSGSLIIQAVLAVVAGAAVLLRTYWEKVRALFGFSPPGGDRDEDE